MKLTGIKKFFLTVVVSVTAVLASTGYAETVNYKFPYPIPNGAYHELRLVPRSTPGLSPCPTGQLFSNTNDNSNLYFCYSSGSYGLLAAVSGIWTLNGNDIYLTDTSNPSSKAMGIGTTSPSFKLTLSGDGGILTTGLLGSSRTLGTSGDGTRLVWYPNKGAFRVGTPVGNQWDDAWIEQATVALGSDTKSAGPYSATLGGESVHSHGWGAVLGGGYQLISSGTVAQILGGKNNYIITGWGSRTSGNDNSITDSDGLGDHFTNTIGGGWTNIAQGVYGTTILGGAGNMVYGEYATVAGGYGAQISRNCTNCTVSGGNTNTADGNDSSSTIAGGDGNAATALYTTVGGGGTNVAEGDYSTVSGGMTNLVSSTYSVISGGNDNTVAAGANYSVLLGSGHNSTVSGAYGTLVGSRDSLSGDHAIVFGVNNSTAGDYSLASGENMVLGATADRTFVWGHDVAPVNITTADAFIVYSGSVGILKSNPGAYLEIKRTAVADDYLALTSTNSATSGDKFIVKSNGNIGVGVTAPTHIMDFAGGAYVSGTNFTSVPSSRSFKDEITPLSLKKALTTLKDLKVVGFDYKKYPQDRHVGFIAEDVPELVATKNRDGVATMDIAAVLTRVIQHQQEILEGQKTREEILNEKVRDLETRIERIRQNRSLTDHE